MKLENPYVIQKHEKIRELEDFKSKLNLKQKKEKEDVEKLTNLQTEVTTFEEMSRQLVQEKLDSIQSRIHTVAEEIREVKVNYPSVRQQYAKAKDLYRQVVGYMDKGEIIKKGLVQEIRELKTQLREEGAY